MINLKDIQKNEGMKESNVLFNNALNTFHLLLYVQAYVKEHLDSEKGNPLSPIHELFFFD